MQHYIVPLLLITLLFSCNKSNDIEEYNYKVNFHAYEVEEDINKYFEFQTFDKNISLPNNLIFDRDIKCNSNGLHFYEMKEEKHKIFSYRNNKLDSFAFNFPDSLYMMGYDYSDSTVTILDPNYFVFYNTNTSNYSLIPHSYRTLYSDLYISHDTIFLWNRHFSNTRKEEKPARVALFSISKQEELSSHEFVMPLGSPLTIMSNRRNLHYQNNHFIVSDISKYHVDLYNTDYQLVSSISCDSLLINDAILSEELELESDYQSFSQGKYQKYWDMNTIDFVDMINDTTILVMRNTLNAVYVYDLWKKSNNKEWILQDTALGSIPLNDTTIISRNNIARFNNSYYIYGNKMFILGQFPIAIDSAVGLTHNEYKKAVDTYYIDNPVSLNIMEYRYVEK